MKYTIEDLKNNNIAVHTPSQAKFNKLTSALNKIETIPFKKDMYKCYKELTCIYHTLGSFGYGNVESRKDMDYKIITIDDIDFEEESVESMMEKPATQENQDKMFEMCCGGKELVQMTSEEARRYIIQKKIEEWANNNNWHFFGLMNDLKDLKEEYRLTRIKPCVEEIGEEDLKFFFNIETTMTKEQAINEELNFNDGNFDFIKDNSGMYRYGGNDILVSACDMIIGLDKQVKIIEDK